MIYIIIGVIVSIILALFIAAAVKISNQSRTVFKPLRDIVATPRDLGIDYIDVNIKTKDGLNINGWYIKGRPKEYTILILHGNGGNISNRLEFISMFYEMGLSVFIIDYRGYGRSEGSPTEKGTYLDSEAAWQYIVKEKNTDPKKTVILGRSLGGPVAARLASKHEPAGLILDSTFSSLAKLASELYYGLPLQNFIRIKYDTLGYLKNVRVPVLFIHSVEDDYIDIQHSIVMHEQRLKESALLKIRGGHNDNYIVSKGIYIEGLKKFIESL